MNAETCVLVTQNNQGVATITLNKPETHNAFGDSMIAELSLAIKSCISQSSVKIIQLNSTGKSFSAGADLQWMQRMAQAPFTDNVSDAKALAELMHLLYACSKPTIAVVQGTAMGGGVGLIACCDIAIVSKDATFCFSEVKLGLIPAVISPYVIQAIGSHQAKTLFLTAEKFNAEKALQLGLCHEVTSPENLISRAEFYISLLLQNGPQALEAVKKLVHHLHPISPEMINHTANQIAKLRTSSEGREGITAFIEKRKPAWATISNE